jgi:hypothetical protein
VIPQMNNNNKLLNWNENNYHEIPEANEEEEGGLY